MSWLKYNHMIISYYPPHYKIKKSDIVTAKKMMKESKAFLIRYTSNFDCKNETEWWYLIKDKPDSLNELKSNDRYEITKGLKRNTIKKIDPLQYDDELFKVYKKAFSRYKKSNLPVGRAEFIDGLINDQNNSNVEYFAVFSNKTGELIGYSKNIVNDDYVSYSTIKFDPEFLSDGCSAALFFSMNNYYLMELKMKYVLDGERSIRHVTNIQEYLVKYFKFRRAYCKLNIIYSPFFKIIIMSLMPFAHSLEILNSHFNLKILNDINSFLFQEKIRRSFF